MTDDGWAGAPLTFADAERLANVAGLQVSPARRLRWLEEAILFAREAGLLPLVYDGDGRRIAAPGRALLRRTVGGTSQAGPPSAS